MNLLTEHPANIKTRKANRINIASGLFILKEDNANLFDKDRQLLKISS